MSVRFKDERKLLGRMDNGIIEDLLHGSIDMTVRATAAPWPWRRRKPVWQELY